MKMLYLQLSLDGATADVNDRIRGNGTHKKILAAADCLASNQVAFSIICIIGYYIELISEFTGDHLFCMSKVRQLPRVYPDSFSMTTGAST